MSVIIPVIFFAILLLIPIKIDFTINANLKNDKIELEPMDGMKNKIKIKLIYFITVFEKDIFIKKENKNKTKSNSNKTTLLKALYKSVTFSKFLVSIGFNTYNVVLNSYINALLNSTLCIYINQNNRKFNFKELYYQVYLSNTPIVINFDTSAKVVPIRFALNYIVFKVKEIKLLKQNNKNVCKKCIS